MCVYVCVLVHVWLCASTGSLIYRSDLLGYIENDKFYTCSYVMKPFQFSMYDCMYDDVHPLTVKKTTAPSFRNDLT